MISNKRKLISLVLSTLIVFALCSSIGAYTGFLPVDTDSIIAEYSSKVAGFSFRRSALDHEGISVLNMVSYHSTITDDAELHSNLSISYYEDEGVKNSLKCSMNFSYNPSLPRSKSIITEQLYPLFQIIFKDNGYSASGLAYILNLVTSCYENKLVDQGWILTDSLGDIMITFRVDTRGTLPTLRCEIYKDTFAPKPSMNLNSLAVVYNAFNSRRIIAKTSSLESNEITFTTTQNNFFINLTSAQRVEIDVRDDSNNSVYKAIKSGSNAIYMNLPKGTYTIYIKEDNWLLDVGQ